MTVLSTANRNFKARMGNQTASIYLASPAVCGTAAANRTYPEPEHLRTENPMNLNGLARVFGDDVNTDYIISSARKRASIDASTLAAFLFESIAPGFAESVQAGDILAGWPELRMRVGDGSRGHRDSRGRHSCGAREELLTQLLSQRHQ
jgi:aconitase A